MIVILREYAASGTIGKMYESTDYTHTYLHMWAYHVRIKHQVNVSHSISLLIYTYVLITGLRSMMIWVLTINRHTSGTVLCSLHIHFFSKLKNGR